MIFGKKPNLDSIGFDRDGWKILEESNAHRMYDTGAGDVVRLAFNGTRPSWTFDLTDLSAATSFYEKQSSDLGGALISLGIENQSNVEILSGVFKYRSPEANSLAAYIVGMIIIPFRKFNYQINVECVERGTTGSREAAVSVILRQKGEWPEPQEEQPVRVESMDDFFDKIRESKVRVVPSDDEKYDNDFPNHPLTIVRDTQFHILDTLEIPEWIASKPKHRL